MRQGDDNWEDIVRWTHFAMLNAEELGISQKNVDDMLKSDAPMSGACSGSRASSARPWA